MCQYSVAQKQEAFPEPVLWFPPGRLSPLGKTSGMAGKGPLAVPQQESCVPKLSQSSTSSTEEGKVQGGTGRIPTLQICWYHWPHPHHLRVIFALRGKETDLVMALKSGGRKDRS